MKSALVEHLAKLWDLVPSRAEEPSMVIEEQVAIAEVGVEPFAFYAFCFPYSVNLQCWCASWQTFAWALQARRLVLSASALERQICEL